jgi:hypothetical protein
MSACLLSTDNLGRNDKDRWGQVREAVRTDPATLEHKPSLTAGASSRDERTGFAAAWNFTVAALAAVDRTATVACNEVQEDEIAKQSGAVQQEVSPPPFPLAGSTSGPDLRLGRGRLVRGLRRFAPKLEKANTALAAPVRIVLEETDNVVLPAIAVGPVGAVGFALGAGHKFKCRE